MYTTKSFCNILAFLSNNPGTNSPIGELTNYGATYSRETGVYHHTSIDGYDLINLRSMNDSTAVKVPQTVVDQAIEMVKICVDRTLSTPGEHYDTAIYDELMTNATRLKFSNLKVGRMVSNGTNWVPSYLTWKDTTAGAADNLHRIWLAIDPFLNQYTDFNHIVVPPLVPIDQFFAAPSVVKTLLDAITPIQMMDRAQEARGGIPETVIRTYEFEYIDPSNTDRKFKTYWTIVINGIAGDNPDSVKDTLVAYILANSSYPRSRWEQILPDIFKRTEFMMVPFYKQYAAQASVLKHGIYSPFIASSTKHTNIIIANVPGYTATHICNNTIFFNFPYRSLAIGTIGSVENRDNKILISDHFPDYMCVGTTDGNGDFNRMSDNTQAWVLKLIEAILLSEAWYDGADLSKGYYRVDRNGVTFIAFTHLNVQYLVATKETLKG